jgi:hypothetical protein
LPTLTVPSLNILAAATELTSSEIFIIFANNLLLFFALGLIQSKDSANVLCEQSELSQSYYSPTAGNNPR